MKNAVFHLQRPASHPSLFQGAETDPGLAAVHVPRQEVEAARRGPRSGAASGGAGADLRRDSRTGVHPVQVRVTVHSNLLSIGQFNVCPLHVVHTMQYRMSHLLVNLGLLDFDLGVPQSCPAAQPLLPNSHQPRQNRADSAALKIQINPTQSTSRCDTLYTVPSVSNFESDVGSD